MSKITACDEATCIAAAGLISILTEDGSHIVITPSLARILAARLPELAIQAEAIAFNHSNSKRPPEAPRFLYPARRTSVQ